MIGVINLFKPPGMTSNRALARLRKITGERYSGHAGTLDPEAAGVLPILMGRASRLFDYLPDKKEYIAEIHFGITTDTLDSEGTVTQRSTVIPARESVIEAMSAFTGEITQVPPAYSAIKQNGVPLYKLARRGVDVEVPERRVKIFDIEYLNQTGKNSHLLRISCSKGTYIRTLCADLGQRLGTVAFMSFLLRTASGNMDLTQAHTLEEIEEMAADSEGFLLPPDSAVAQLPAIVLGNEYWKKAVNGCKINYSTEDIFAARLYCEEKFLGIVRTENNTIIPRAILASSEETR